ncbi:hypothetical protein C8C82_0462 [Flavobacterium sp. 81]|uniref:hypothetical protein n=1 Tax=Flavobacterium sp. 81 TaxID=2135621 RepID=UPI000F15E8FB|nr:hypothetical protein C8C82_0462 [Flavobacterium sp. 81]
METNEIEKLAKLKRLTAQYFTTLKPTKDKNTYTVQFKIVNYLELGCVITDMLKLCILALDHDMHKIDQKKTRIYKCEFDSGNCCADVSFG